MKLKDWLKISNKKLEDSDISTARLDCLVLLEDVLGKNRTHLLANPDIDLSKAELSVLNEYIERRALHEPLAYIRGKSEFYGREFLVNSRTLEPRPETETLIDMLKSIKLKEHDRIADIGTGSGCIAITVKLELPELDVFATDIDQSCITTGFKNARKLGADITFYKGNLIEPLHGLPLTVVLSNLPYVPDKYELNQAAKFEPRRAIFGGEDGLDLYRKMFAQISSSAHRPVHVLTESLPFQHGVLTEIAMASRYGLLDTDDFIQHFTTLNNQ